MLTDTAEVHVAKLLEWHELNAHLRLTGWGLPAKGILVGSTQLRQMHASGELTSRRAEVESPDPTRFKELVNALSDWLRDFTVDGCIGDGLAGFGGEVTPPMDSYAKRLVRGAAVLGSARVVELLRGWTYGTPARSVNKITLSSMSPNDQPPRVGIDGIWIETTPKSFTLRTSQPSPSGMLPTHATLGRYVLMVEETRAGLYQPRGKGEWPHSDIPSYACKRLKGAFRHEMFCYALSLICDADVRWMLHTTDQGELVHLGSDAGLFGATSYPGDLTISGVGGPQTPISQPQFEEALRVYVKLAEVSDPNLIRALSRWANSKRFATHTGNKLIELRIALEALWGGKGELSFRTSLVGARHLRTGVEERKRLRNEIRRVYSLASRTVHGDIQTFGNGHHQTLELGQAICREGILRCLEAGTVPDQDELLLG